MQTYFTPVGWVVSQLVKSQLKKCLFSPEKAVKHVTFAQAPDMLAGSNKSIKQAYTERKCYALKLEVIPSVLSVYMYCK